MNCDSVCIGSDWGEPGSCNSLKIVTARKAHECCECRRAIVAGSRYEVQTALFDGDFGRYRTCLECKEIRDAFCCDGYIFGDLWDSARMDLFPEIGQGCFDRLSTASAKSFLAERWREWKGLE